MRIFLIALLLLIGCGQTVPTQVAETPKPPVVVSTPSPTPAPTPAPTPSPTPAPVADKLCLVNVPDSAIPKIFKAYADWKYLLTPTIVKQGCNVIVKGTSDAESYTPEGGHYNGFWWFYDNLHHIFINVDRGDNWTGTFPHELGHRFWLPHKLLPESEYDKPYAHKTSEGYMDCRSIMSTCSLYGITDQDREELKQSLKAHGEQGFSAGSLIDSIDVRYAD